MRLTGIVMATAIGACSALPTSGETLTGEWGGAHIGLRLDSSGGAIEYDCAQGTIDEPVHLDAAGRFSVRGTHTPNTGGPEQMDVERPRLPAQYSGRVSGARMTLSVRAPDEIGPFTLARGAQPGLLRCL